MTKSLWPDVIGATKVNGQRSAVSILREQAALLGEKTQNLVIAKVDSRAGQESDLFGNVLEGMLSKKIDTTAHQVSHRFYDIFYLVAPALNNYRFELFRVTHSIEQHYPLRIYSGTLDINGQEITSEKELLEVLALIFSHLKTINIIETMLIQSGWSAENIG